MNCEKIQQKFLEMDNRSRVPLSVQFHILHCSKCRHDISVLSEQFSSLRSDTAFDLDRDRCEQIMREVFMSKVR